MSNNSQYWPKPPQTILNIETSEVLSDNGFGFYLKSGKKMLANCSITKIDEYLYDLGGVYVDSSLRKNGLGIKLMNMVNSKLDELSANGTAVAVDGSHVLYEKSGWIKGEYVSHGDRGGTKCRIHLKIKYDFRMDFNIFLGASIASFLQMYLDTSGENILRKKSRCDGCGRDLSWWAFMPVVSWLGNFVFNNGKTKCCGKKLDWRYVVGEVLLGLWFVGSYLYFYTFQEGVVLSSILGSVFFVLVMEDLGEMQVSSKTLYLLCAVGIVGALIHLDIIYPLIIFLPYWLIYLFGKYKNMQLIGEADPYVFSSLGIFFGTQFSISLFLYSVWLGAGIGIVYLIFINKKFERNVRLPFLPIIFIACLFILLFQLSCY